MKLFNILCKILFNLLKLFIPRIATRYIVKRTSLPTLLSHHGSIHFRIIAALITRLIWILGNVWHSFIVNILLWIFTILDDKKQLFINPFDFLDDPLKILNLDGQKCRHTYHFLDPNIIISIIIELVKTIRNLLRLGKKQKAVFNLLFGKLTNIPRDFLDHSLN